MNRLLKLKYTAIPMIINSLDVQGIPHALYIVSGDKDLLVINEYEKIKIVTAKDFSSNICPPDYIDWLYIKQNIKFCRSL